MNTGASSYYQYSKLRSARARQLARNRRLGRFRRQLGKSRIDIFHRLFAFLHHFDMLIDCLYQMIAAFAREGRNFEHPAFEPEALDEVLDDGFALAGIYHVAVSYTH